MSLDKPHSLTEALWRFLEEVRPKPKLFSAGWPVGSKEESPVVVKAIRFQVNFHEDFHGEVNVHAHID